ALAAVMSRCELHEWLSCVQALGWQAEAAWPEHGLWLQMQVGPALALRGGNIWFSPDGKKAACLSQQLFVDWAQACDIEIWPDAIAATADDEAERMVFLVAIPQGLRDCLHWEPAVTWTALAARAAGSTSGGVLQG